MGEYTGLRHEAAALVAERFGVDPAELGPPLIRGWVQRYDCGGAGPHILHHVDPDDRMVGGQLHARAYCGLGLPREQLWWRAPDEVVAAAVSLRDPRWRACHRCAERIPQIDHEGGSLCR